MHHFDPEALESYLAAYVDGFTTLDRMEKFDAGQSNPTYRIASGSNTFVLRAKPPGKLLKSAHAVDREFRVMKALAATSVPVPKVLHLSADETPLGPQFMVMEWLNGRIFWDPALPSETVETRRKIYDQMNETLVQLHQIDPTQIGLSEFGRPGNYFGRQLARWTEQYRKTETDPLPKVHWLIAWLDERLVTDDGAASIVHGDFRIDNMIFCHESHVILGLLDWELSTLGHPLADLAYQCMQWRLPHVGDFKGLGGVDRVGLGLPTEEDYVATYCQRRGIDTPADWPFYLVFSYFRLLAILQGVLKRGLDGNASNPRDQRFLQSVITLLADDAHDLARNSV